MRNKVYKIRNKETDEFISLGYSQRSTWLTFPNAAIKGDTYVLENHDKYEVVIYEYKEIGTLPLIKNKI